MEQLCGPRRAELTGPELRAIRKRLGLTQEALAKLVGVGGKGTVYRWECGKRKVPRSVEIILAEAKINASRR